MLVVNSDFVFLNVFYVARIVESCFCWMWDESYLLSHFKNVLPLSPGFHSCHREDRCQWSWPFLGRICLSLWLLSSFCVAVLQLDYSMFRRGAFFIFPALGLVGIPESEDWCLINSGEISIKFHQILIFPYYFFSFWNFSYMVAGWTSSFSSPTPLTCLSYFPLVLPFCAAFCIISSDIYFQFIGYFRHKFLEALFSFPLESYWAINKSWPFTSHI